MDPVSLFGLIAACASLATNCAKAAMALNELCEAYKTAELSILTLIEECATIQCAWGQIETWMQQNKNHMEERQVVLERLERSVYVGQLTMSALEADIKKAIPKSGTFRRRASFTFIKGLLQDYQGRIRGQVSALQLLLQVMNMPHYEDRTEILTIHELAFREVDESVMSICPSQISSRYSIVADDIAGMRDNGPIQYIPFSFDNDLFTSLPYSRNYRPIPKPTTFVSSLRSSMDIGGSPQRRSTTDSLIKGKSYAQKELVSKHITHRLEAAGFF